MTSTDLLDVSAVAELAGVSVASIYTYLTRGTIPEPDLRFGRSPVWRRRTIEKWLASRPAPGQHATKARKR